MLGALVLLATTAGATHIETPPSDPRLAAFQQFCLPQRLDTVATIEGFQQAGWAVVTEPAHPELRAVLRLDAARVAALGDAQAETIILKRLDLFATVNTVTAEIDETETARYATCAIWDFEARAGIPDALVGDMTQAPPNVRLNRPFGRVVQWDLGGELPGAGNLQTSFYPEGSPAVAQTGFTGAAIFLTSDLDALP